MRIALCLFLAVAAWAEVPDRPGFAFGSYGRVGAGSDLRGGSGRSANIVAHGSRLEELPYLELDLYYGLRGDNAARARVVMALAVFGDFFHTTGEADEDWGVRNAYVEASGLPLRQLTFWAGSRMLRGDDIYLLDFWPLDNLNTVGGGASLGLGRTQLSLHVGLTRVEDLYQFQVSDQPSPAGGSESVVVLDRPRTIISVAAEHFFEKWKVKAYAEAHHLPSGTALVQESADTKPEEEERPSDVGWLAGSQLGLWGFAPGSFVNLWFRVAGGLAAYGENAVPFGIDDQKRSADAREVLLAAAANWEWWKLGLLFGGYARYFHDADGNEVDIDDGWEWTFAFRPHFFFWRYFSQAAEFSLQGRDPHGASPVTGEIDSPRVTRISLIPLITPLGPGSLTRPHLRLVYSASFRNSAAQDLLNPADPRASREVEHFAGIQAEWWFDASYGGARSNQ